MRVTLDEIDKGSRKHMLIKGRRGRGEGCIFTAKRERRRGMERGALLFMKARSTEIFSP